MKTAALFLLLVAGLAYAATTEGPETVTIDDVNHWFAPVEFAHADHLGMAEACNTCHHDQEPADAGACGDCHNAVYDPADPDTPDLKMAYHLLCMGCHKEAGATLECVGCHARQALPDGPPLKAGEMR